MFVLFIRDVVFRAVRESYLVSAYAVVDVRSKGRIEKLWMMGKRILVCFCAVVTCLTRDRDGQVEMCSSTVKGARDWYIIAYNWQLSTNSRNATRFFQR